MLKLKKEARRAICALLISAMLCSDAGLTGYAAEQKISEETVGEATDQAGEVQREEPRTEDSQLEEPSAEEGSTGDSRTEEDLPGEGETEGSSSEEGRQEDTSSEETPKDEEAEGDSDFGKEDDKTGAEEDEPVEGDTVPGENTDAEDAENPGDASEGESVSENDVDHVEGNIPTLLTVGEDAVASGEYKENGSNTAWVIDADGKLTVEGTGEFADGGGYKRAPWYEQRELVTSAEIKLAGTRNASYMFYGCSNLASVDVSGFNTSQITNMNSMFYGCDSLKKLDLTGFDTSRVKDMGWMFYGCDSLRILEVRGFDTGSVTNMIGMFEECNSLVNLNVSGFNTSRVTDMSWMFYGCGALSNLDVSGFDTGKVTDMNNMFGRCGGLTSLNLSGFDTSHVTDMGWMFGGCGGLTAFDMSGFNTSRVTNMQGMFSACGSLGELNLSSFNTAQVKNMRDMFHDCTSLRNVDLSSFDTSQVIYMDRMFYRCSLDNLDLSSFDTSKVTSAEEMFREAFSYKLQTMRTPYNLRISIALPGWGRWYLMDGKKITELPQNLDHSILIKYASEGLFVSKVKTDYVCGDTLNLDDITVTYYDADGVEHVLESGEYTTNADEIDMSVAGEKELIIEYQYDDGENEYGVYLRGTIELQITDDGSGAGPQDVIANGKYQKDGSDTTWVIDKNGKLTVEGIGEFADKAYYDYGWRREIPWAGQSSYIKSAEIHVTEMTDASYMFYYCNNLVSVDVSGFDTSQVTDMQSMFYGCESLRNLDVSGFDTSQVTDMNDMFYGCESLRNLDVSGFNTSRVTDMGDMFFGCKSLRNLDVSGFDTSQVTDMESMFRKCKNLTRLDISGFDTSQVTDMSGMFGQCNNLSNLDVSEFNTSRVMRMDSMFSGCSSLTSLDVSGFDTTQVTSMSWMFGGCSNLTNLDVSGFDTSQVEYMYDMFSNCSSLTSLDVSGFDTSQVTSMSWMFGGCSNLTNLDVSGFDTGQVEYMYDMFSNCSSLTSLDVSGFDTSQVTSLDDMFSGCSALINLNLSSFDFSRVAEDEYSKAYHMLRGCNKLKTIQTPWLLEVSVALPEADLFEESPWKMPDGTAITELPQALVESVLISKKIVGAIRVTKEKTEYARGNKLDIDDITVIYYDTNGTELVIESGQYTTNADQIDMSTVGKKTLMVRYHADGRYYTGKIELTVTDNLLTVDNTKIMLTDTADSVYDGNPQMPNVRVIYKISDNSVSSNSLKGTFVNLKQGTDYTVSYENNVNAFEDEGALETAQDAPKVVITGRGKYGGTLSKAFTIQKAAAPQAEVCLLNISDYHTEQSGRKVDLSGYFADYQKTGYTAGEPMEDDTVAGSVILGQPSVDENGILTYHTLAGTKGDFAIIPVAVAFANYRDSLISVKVELGGDSVEPVSIPTATPESGRQLAAGSTITLTCGTAGAEIYYTTGASLKELANPTEKGVRYTEPLTIDNDMYIRAVAMKGSNCSKTVTFHYTVLTVADKVMKPYAVPGQGVVDKGTKIELKNDMPDAMIYYVTGKNADVLGAVPADDSYKYTEPIEIAEDMVIKAVARKEGMKDSDAAVFVYRVNAAINAPAADPVTGAEVDRGSYISLTADSDADIYYTTDQSDPAVSGTAKLYERRIKVEGDAGSVIVIRAAAEKKGIYSDTVTFTYTVSEDKAKGLQVMLAGSDEFIYTGSAITPEVIVTNNGEELTEGEDYTVRYSNNVKAADKDASRAPRITVTGKGNLTKSRSITFSILPMYIGDEEEVVGGSMVAVRGKTAAPVLFYGGVKLTAKDFVNPVAKKKYDTDETITITGKGNFEGTRDIDVRVVNKEDMKKFAVVIDNIALKNEPLVYDGEAKTMDGYFEVFDKQDKSSPLEEYSDYAVIYPKNNINAGKVKFTVVGLGEYFGTVTKTYTIKPRVVKTEEDGDMQVNVEDGDSYSFKNGGVTISDLVVTCDGDTLIHGKDYKVTYSGNKKICRDNKAKCTISFKGNYKGSKALVRKFNITPAMLDDVDQINGSVSVAAGDMVYTGKRGVYKSIPFVTAHGVLLKSSDYKVSYYKDSDRKQVIDGKTPSSSVDLTSQDRQTVYVKIEGKGNYEGVLTTEYNVYKLSEGVIDLARAKVTIVGGNKQVYTGEGVSPDIEILYKSGTEWKKVDANDIGTYVKVTYINNVNKGKATVMVNGTGGKYAGSKTAVFSIISKSMQ